MLNRPAEVRVLLDENLLLFRSTTAILARTLIVIQQK